MIESREQGPPEEEPTKSSSDLDERLKGSDTAVEPTVEPERGGFVEGRDPKEDMPVIPGVPETKDDPKSHDAAPGGGEPSVP